MELACHEQTPSRPDRVLRRPDHITIGINDADHKIAVSDAFGSRKG